MFRVNGGAPHVNRHYPGIAAIPFTDQKIISQSVSAARSRRVQPEQE